ncbi:MAG: DegT/DnrJ/EryC1/StrS family aminotransferase [Polyangiaceae bacterium]
MAPPPITLFDAQRQYAPLLDELTAAARRVIASGRYVLGPEVEAFETEIGAWLGAEHAVGVSSGSDALVLALHAAGVEPGDDVVVPAYSFIATSEAVRRVGARPVFADVRDDTFDLDAERVAAALTPRTRAVIGVHLFGQPCDAWALRALCDDSGIVFIEDAAQAFGAGRLSTSASDDADDATSSVHRTPDPHEAGASAPNLVVGASTPNLVVGASAPGHAVGCIGHLACFSFFPAKVFGGFGDGGLVTTADPGLASRVKSLRQHGLEGGDAQALGGNYRLDALQAALLRVTLPHVRSWIARRQAVAAAYDEALATLPGVRVPARRVGTSHVFAAYALRVAAGARDELRRKLRAAGIESAVYYPKTLPAMRANADLPPAPAPIADALTRELVALPVHPCLEADEISRVVTVVRGSLRKL